MVELEPNDYNEILNWFTHTFGKINVGDTKSLPPQAIKTFWKLTFLAEDKLREIEEMMCKEDEQGG